jgi:uncharacterized protein YndB with AHSA1/START domain
MSQQATDLAVRRSIVVEAPQARAFTVFTEGMSTWWPLETHHIGEQKAEAAVVEPRAGGRWYERAADGTECEWGRVIAWEPPERVVFGWHLGPEWKYDPDEASATEVEVRFVVEGPTTTRVELEHRGFERLGERADELRIPVAGEGGWSGLLELFSKAL